MTIKADNKYTEMQKSIYAGIDNPMYYNDGLVNNFQPMKFLYEGMSGKNRIALDFGCGWGRAIIHLKDYFKRIDGCDLMESYLKKAKELTKERDLSPKLYLTDGVSLSGIPSDTYDLVFSSSVMQHICVYEIRFNIFKDMYRVLKKGGWMSAEMGFSTSRYTDYYANKYESQSTNSGDDVAINSVDQINTDLTNIGFRNFDYMFSDKPNDINDFHDKLIFFKAQK